MNDLELEETPTRAMTSESSDSASARQRAAKPVLIASVPVNGIRVGTLVGMIDEGHTPLVVFPGQSGSAAIPARATLDLHSSHIGHEVAMMFEDGDVARPIIVGCLMVKESWPTSEQPPQVEVDVDGERMIVTAKEQLVLRCGKASLTLTKAGKVLIQGTYVSSRSSGVIRIKGGSIQLN